MGLPLTNVRFNMVINFNFSQETVEIYDFGIQSRKEFVHIKMKVLVVTISSLINRANELLSSLFTAPEMKD